MMMSTRTMPFLALLFVTSSFWISSALGQGYDGYNYNVTEYAARHNVTVERWIEVRNAMMTSQASSAFRSTPTLSVRKEVREMTCDEWDAYVKAVKTLYQSENWANFTRVHDNERQLIWDLSHSDARQKLYTFLPWHRLWLRGIERELQKIDPKATIPYWNWALDSAVSSLATAAAAFCVRLFAISCFLTTSAEPSVPLSS